MKNVTINGQFYYEVWFEIFVTKENGETQSISNVDSYDKIWQEMDILYARNPEYKSHLNWDVWGSLDEEGWNTVQIDNYKLEEIEQ